jgi:hypothetical protein
MGEKNMIIRFSKMLSDKIHESDLSVVSSAENPYLDWHAHIFRHRRAQYIMVSNSKSLFSIFMHVAGVTNFQRFFERMRDILRDTLHDIGADLIYQRIIAPNTGSILLAKAQDKRIISSMNDHIGFAKAILDDEEISPYDLSFRINENILTIIKYATPKEAFLGMDAEMGKDAKPESKLVQQPENKNVINPAFVQEKPIGSGRHLRLWKSGSEKT